MKLAALAVLATGLLLGIRFLEWRANKIALLEPPPPVAASAAVTPGPNPALLLFGDSRVAQWQPLPARPYAIIASGFPGETAIRLSARLPSELARTRPAMVMLQLGVNDGVAAAVAGRERRHQALADSLAAFESMAAATRAAGAGLIILKVLPPVRPDLLRRLVYGRRLGRFVAELNAGLPDIAARHDALLLDPLPLLVDAHGEVADRYRRDTLHFTPAAYQQMAALFPEAIENRG